MKKAKTRMPQNTGKSGTLLHGFGILNDGKKKVLRTLLAVALTVCMLPAASADTAGGKPMTAENSANSVIQAVADMSGATSLAQKANPNAPWNQPVVDNKSDKYWGDNNKSAGAINIPPIPFKPTED